jgi:hypothetical protein
MRAIAATLWLACVVRAEAPPDSCVKCHEKEAATESASIHRREQVGCASCHGGDPGQADKEKAHGPQVRKIARTEIPALCAKCHSDVRMMNPFGIPTDQFAQYQTSRHGLKLAEGDTEVATCADCHGSNGIRKAKDPESPVFPKNVPATCAKCHADADLMKKHGLKSTAPKDYGESVHAQLLEKGDLSAPTCITCHGNHGATPPGVRDIIRVCGKCHVKEQELFSLTKHAALTEKGDFQSCVTCHRNHLIRTKQEDIRKSCKLCHGDDTDPARTRFTSIFSTIHGAEERFQGAKDRLQRMEHAGFAVDDEAVLLEDAKTAVLRLKPVQHALDESKVAVVANEADAAIAEINRRLDGKERTELWKKRSLVPLWAFLLGMAGLFWMKLGRIKRDAA